LRWLCPAIECGLSRIEIVERILNHASGSFRGVCGIYQKYDFGAEKREALSVWAAHVATLQAPEGLPLAA
jgi:hypothetical protein